MKESTLMPRMVFSILAGLCMTTVAAAHSPQMDAQAHSSQTLSQSAPPDSDVYPVVSIHLSPGFVEARSVDIPGLNPVFLVGNDSLSRNWLRSNKNLLHRLNALGLVVNATSAESVNELRDLSDGLVLLPVTGDDLAGLVDLEHYPVLITPTYLEQGL